MDAYLVYVTAQDPAEARRIAEAVVHERLAACANVLGAVVSVYWWEDRVCTDNEAVLVLKTSAERRTELIRRIKDIHSYDTPCIVCLPLTDGNPDFLDWIKEETAPR